jgi:hypothetical protein
MATPHWFCDRSLNGKNALFHYHLPPNAASRQPKKSASRSCKCYTFTSVADLDALDFLDKEDLLKLVKGLMGQGITLSFRGKRTAREIAKRVRPRVTRTMKQ